MNLSTHLLTRVDGEVCVPVVLVVHVDRGDEPRDWARHRGHRDYEKGNNIFFKK